MKTPALFTKLLKRGGNREAKMFSAANDENGLVIDLYGVVGDYWDGNEGTDLLRILNRNKTTSEIMLNVHTPGGYFTEGINIFNQFKSHKANVTAVVQGIAASMGSVILMSANKIMVHEASWIMIHEASTLSVGRVSDLEAELEWLKGVNTQAAEIYHDRTGLSMEKIREMMAAETWMDGKTAVELGFADELIPLETAQQTASAQMLAASKESLPFAALDVYNNIPLNCLPAEQTATLLGKINTSEQDNVAKPTAEEIEKANATMAATKIKQPSLQEVKDAKAILQAAGSDEPAPTGDEPAPTGDEPAPTGDEPAPTGDASKDATAIAQMCQLAGKDDLITGYLAAGNTVGQVRADLAAKKQAELNATPSVKTHFGDSVNMESTTSLAEMAADSCKKQGLIN